MTMIARWKQTWPAHKFNIMGMILAAIAASGAVVVTTLQYKQSKSNFILDQRPWLGVFDERTTKVVAGQPIDANFEMMNFGKSPALNTTLSLDYFSISRMASVSDDYFEEKANKEVEARAKTFTEQEYVGAVAPSGRFQTPMRLNHIVPTEADLAMVRQRNLRFYIFGIIRYSGHDPDSHYETKFCFKIDEDVGQKMDDTGFMVHSCKTWSDMR